MWPFESRVSMTAFRKFAAGVTLTDPDGVESVQLALIDREIERWSAASDAVVQMDVLTLASSTPVKRGWGVKYGIYEWQVRDRMSDDGHLVEFELKRIKSDV
jgi:hypothetical protein